ncbi:MAG: hypothetical protein H0T60_01495 [Acidobacteria bacterium]|nr:hypothetical protein [Acidobacteriota bacterium]
MIFAVFFAYVVSAHGILLVWTSVASAITLLGYTLFLLEWYVWREPSERRKARTIFLLAGVLIVVFGGVWQSRIEKPVPPHRTWLRFTDEERRRFIAALASQTEPRERVRIGCPAANEDICVLVTPFVDAFKRGHFVVENDRVERVTLGKPSAGVILFRYGHADAFDPQDPDQGVWSKITPSLETIEAAFAEIGINSQSSADQQLPEDAVGIYFGIEPHEPIEREDLKRLRQDAEKQLGPTP